MMSKGLRKMADSGSLCERAGFFIQGLSGSLLFLITTAFAIIFVPGAVVSSRIQ